MDESKKIVLYERNISPVESRTESRNEKEATFGLGKPFVCDFCGKGFWTKQQKTTHLRVHTGEKPFECEYCNKKFAQKGHLQNHYKVHVKKSLCKDKNITNPSPRKQLCLTHEQKIINKCTAGYEYNCQFCEKKFPAKAHLSVHLRVHTQEKPFECSVCFKRFSQVGNLKTHILVHTNLKPFECNVCQKIFRQKGNLQAHYKIHTKEKQFVCQVCHKKFSQKGNLLSHEKLHQEREKSYNCSFCFKAYKNKVCFQNHLQMHNKSNVHQAKLIEKTYHVPKTENTSCEKVEQSNLVVLEKEECPIIDKIVDVTKYVCAICGESFDKNKSLNLHYKVHLETLSRKILQISSKQSGSVDDNTNAIGRITTSKAVLPQTSDSCMEKKKLETVQDSNNNKALRMKNDSYVSLNAVSNNLSVSLNEVKNSSDKLPNLEEDTSNTNDSLIDAINYVIDPKDMSFICRKCGKRFSGKPSFLIHYKIHSGMQLYECGICNKKFNQCQSLKLHLKIHSGEKPLKCNICFKAFRQKPNLMVHLRVHTGEKPYQCEICNKCFAHKSSLNVHLRSKHNIPNLQEDTSNAKDSSIDATDLAIDTKDGYFVCSKCGKRFSGKSSFLIHYRIHSGMQLYECEVRHKKFNQTQNLKVHLKSHSGERPFKCDICTKTFRQKPNLMMHLRLHTGEKPYQCEICNKCFTQKSSLNVHLHSIHNSKKQGLVLENSQRQLRSSLSNERRQFLPKLTLRKELDIGTIYSML